MVNAVWTNTSGARHQPTGFGVRKVPRMDPLGHRLHRQAAVTDLPSLEREVAARWVRSELASRTVARPAAEAGWTCYVEPLSPAGVPGTTHLRLLALADLYPRFKAMQGFEVTVSRG